jgi:predicted Zn finger-like uncharacterized protein
MIIICINCSKKFDVNSDQIPSEGRTIQCGSCNHVWFFNKNLNNFEEQKPEIPIKKIPIKKKKQLDKFSVKKEKNVENDKGTEIIEYSPKSNFTLSKFLSYIIVTIISFIALVILLDTFKTPLYNYFPNLEFILFNLFETLKDINLFIKDLI